LEEFVVPRSSKYLDVTDGEGNQLWSIVLFKSHAESYKAKAKNELKIFLRECEFNVKTYEEDKKKRIDLTESKTTMKGELQKNCETIYGALFECLMHIKVLRVHVECVLRWSYPPKYAMCVFSVFLLMLLLIKNRCCQTKKRRLSRI
jgi:hypothetical protein